MILPHEVRSLLSGSDRRAARQVLPLYHCFCLPSTGSSTVKSTKGARHRRAPFVFAAESDRNYSMVARTLCSASSMVAVVSSTFM